MGESHCLVPTMKDLPASPCNWVWLLWSFCSVQVMLLASKAAGVHIFRRMSWYLSCDLSYRCVALSPESRNIQVSPPPHPRCDDCLLCSLPLGGYNRNYLFNTLMGSSSLENTFCPLTRQPWCDQCLQAIDEESGLCPSCLLLQVRHCHLIKKTCPSE